MLQLILPILRKYWVYIFTALVIICLTLSVARKLWKPAPVVPETSKPAVVQADGSVILAKAPDANAKAPMAIPKGSIVERVVKIMVQAKNPIQSISGTVEVKETVTQMDKSAPVTIASKSDHIADDGKMVECPPVTLNLALVRDSDQTRRVIASSDDGIILGGVDIPVSDALPIPEPKTWSIGAVANPFKQTIGGYVDHDYGFVRLGATLMQSSTGKFPADPTVKVGIVF